MLIADTLSRPVVALTTDLDDEITDKNGHHVVEATSILSTDFLSKLEDAQKDPVIQALYDIVCEGWPHRRQKVNTRWQPYWAVRDTISLRQDL